MNWQDKKLADEQRKIEETGGNQTVFSVSHSDIRDRGVTMCKTHSWKKLSDNEVACIICPTAQIVKPEELESLLQN